MMYRQSNFALLLSCSNAQNNVNAACFFQVKSSKQDSYANLVAARKRCCQCRELKNPSSISAGQLDSNEIGPYSRWQGNLNAPLVPVAQDFADIDTFIRLGGRPGEKVQTNLALVELLGKAGFKIDPPHENNHDNVLFFTNAVLCLKSGSMQKAVPKSCTD